MFLFLKVKERMFIYNYVFTVLYHPYQSIKEKVEVNIVKGQKQNKTRK